MMEAVRTSETSVYYNETTRRYIPEGSNLHTRRRENLKSHRPTEARGYNFPTSSIHFPQGRLYYGYIHCNIMNDSFR